MLQGRSIARERVDARGGGDIAADLHEEGKADRHAVAGTGLQRIGCLVAAVGLERHARAVAGEEDGISSTCERIAAKHVEGEAHLPSRLDLAIRAESGRGEARIQHPECVKRGAHPPIDRGFVSRGGGGADLDVAVARRGVTGGGVVGESRGFVMRDLVVLDHVEGVVVVALAPGRVLGHGGKVGRRPPGVEAIQPGAGSGGGNWRQGRHGDGNRPESPDPDRQDSL